MTICTQITHRGEQCTRRANPDGLCTQHGPAAYPDPIYEKNHTIRWPKVEPKAKLSKRVRPDCEAAPWVIDAIKQLELELELYRQEQEGLMDEIETLKRRESSAYSSGYQRGKAVGSGGDS